MESLRDMFSPLWNEFFVFNRVIDFFSLFKNGFYFSLDAGGNNDCWFPPPLRVMTRPNDAGEGVSKLGGSSSSLQENSFMFVRSSQFSPNVSLTALALFIIGRRTDTGSICSYLNYYWSLVLLSVAVGSLVSYSIFLLSG